MKPKRTKSSVGRVCLFVLFVMVIALVAVRLDKESQMRERVEKRSRELDIEAAQASAEYADVLERSRISNSDDYEYVEEIARESLGMVMPGETIFSPNEE